MVVQRWWVVMWLLLVGLVAVWGVARAEDGLGCSCQATHAIAWDACETVAETCRGPSAQDLRNACREVKLSCDCGPIPDCQRKRCKRVVDPQGVWVKCRYFGCRTVQRVVEQR